RAAVLDSFPNTRRQGALASAHGSDRRIEIAVVMEAPLAHTPLDVGPGRPRSHARRGDRAAARRAAAQSRSHAAVVGAPGAQLERLPANAAPGTVVTSETARAGDLRGRPGDRGGL